MKGEYIRKMLIFKGKVKDLTPANIERGWYQAKSGEAITSTEQQCQLDTTDIEILSMN